MAVVAAGGYEYTVTVLAILALGGTVEEAVYFIGKSRAVLVLASSLDLSKCLDLEERIATTSDKYFRAMAIQPSISSPTLDTRHIVISLDRALRENAPAVVILTSGTTGVPMAAVMRRSFNFDRALEVADHYQLNEDDVVLHVLPVHHATGVGTNFFLSLIPGSRKEFRSGGFDEQQMWEQWKQHASSP
ncbi:hypothetical protein G6011_02922 [Alternaria panax]|uniref:AMP-dependent synthetase/ligase domain-containing protein n=1 Tax=Alternaria panax TaxID=48097 RepID=A0AAD4FB52_9PLEO|nr:hypothetical protein G6011_02922 [Alternaria panax]